MGDGDVAYAVGHLLQVLLPGAGQLLVFIVFWYSSFITYSTTPSSSCSRPGM